MSEDTWLDRDRAPDERRCVGFEVGNGDYIVCDPHDAHAWIRSDTAVTLDGTAGGAPDDATRER